jgi:hypothetical protein
MMNKVKCCLFSICFLIQFLPGRANAQIIAPDEYDWIKDGDRTPVNPQFAGASAVVIREVKILNFYYNKGEKKETLQSEVTFHKVIQLNDTRAMEAYNRLYIPLSGVTDIEQLKARTISPDGKVTDLDQSKIKEVENKEGEGKYKIFAFEGLEKGCRLEYLYKLKKEVEYSFRSRIQTDDPVQLAQVYIVSPENLKFEYKVYNGKSETLDTVEKGISYSIITARNVPGKTEENYSAYEAGLMRVEIQLAYNTAFGKGRILTFNSAVKQQYPLLYTVDPKALKVLQKVSKQIGLNKLQPEDKIRHIEDYIKTNIQGVKNAGADYQDVQKILQNKIANEAGMARLYIAFFKANGINCETVYTTDRNKINFDADFESWLYLENIIFYFPDFDKYLDPSDVSLRYPWIPSAFTLNNGLFLEPVEIGKLKSATASVKKIPAPPGSKSGEVIDAFCSFNPSLDSVTVQVKRSFLGILANVPRYVYDFSQKDDKKKILDELMRFPMKDAMIEEEHIQNYDMMDNDKPLEISGIISGTDLIEKTGRDMLFKVGDLLGPQSELYQEKERQSQIDMFYAHHYLRTLKVQIPQGYKLSGLDALKMNVKFDGNGGEACGFVSDYVVKDNLLTININEYYNVIQLPKEQFENFRKVINAAADFNKVNIVFEKM